MRVEVIDGGWHRSSRSAVGGGAACVEAALTTIDRPGQANALVWHALADGTADRSRPPVAKYGPFGFVSLSESDLEGLTRWEMGSAARGFSGSEGLPRPGSGPFDLAQVEKLVAAKLPPGAEPDCV